MYLDEDDDPYSSSSDEGFSTHSSDNGQAVSLRANQGGVYSHYDPSRTKKIYATKSQDLQRWVKELWDR